MSLPRFNDVNSTSSFGSRHGSTRSTRPPTYVSNATAVPINTPNAWRSTIANDRNEFNDINSTSSSSSHRDSTRSTRPPTYVSNATALPIYTPNAPNAPRTTSAYDQNESVRGWSLRGLSVASQDSDTVFDQAESSRTEIDSIEETSAETAQPAGPRYIYYRVYAEDGAIPSVNPVYSDDPYLGRISAQLVTPPHTVRNLKDSLSGVEGVPEYITTSLFISASSQTPMDEARRVSLFAYPGLGCTPHKPIAIVAKFSGEDRNGDIPTGEGESPFERQYMYYMVYKRGAVISKRPVDSNSRYLGSINVDCIPPPHTAKSIVRCISKIEKVENCGILRLFTSISDESPIGDGHISILTSNRPGPTPEEPMAFVVRTKQVRVTRPSDYDSRNPGWLTTKNPIDMLAYEVCSAAGEVGFVLADRVEPI